MAESPPVGYPGSDLNIRENEPPSPTGVSVNRLTRKPLAALPCRELTMRIHSDQFEEHRRGAARNANRPESVFPEVLHEAYLMSKVFLISGNGVL